MAESRFVWSPTDIRFTRKAGEEIEKGRVRGHYRTLPSGERVWVSSHRRRERRSAWEEDNRTPLVDRFKAYVLTEEEDVVGYGHQTNERKQGFLAAVEAFEFQAPSLDYRDYDYIQMVPHSSGRLWQFSNDGAQGWRHRATGWTIPDYCRQRGGTPELWHKDDYQGRREVTIAPDSPILHYALEYEKSFAQFLKKSRVKGYWRTLASGKRVWVKPHERKGEDQPRYDRFAHLSSLEDLQETRRRAKEEWEGAEAVVAKEEPEPVEAERIIVGAVGELTAEMREELFHARLSEMGIKVGETASRIRLMPESETFLGAWYDMKGKLHYIRIPSGRRVGRPAEKTHARRRKRRPQALSEALREQLPAGAKPVRHFRDSETGTLVVLLPEEVKSNWRNIKTEQLLREDLAAMEIAAHSIPPKPASPTPHTNIDRVIGHIRPVKAQKWIKGRCQEWADVIWQRERSAVRFEVVKPYPQERPSTYMLIGVYEQEFPRRVIVFPLLRDWDSDDPPPAPLGAVNVKRDYAGPLMRKIHGTPQQKWMLVLAAKLAPLFSLERTDTLRRIEGGNALTIRQVLGLAHGLRALETQLLWEAHQYDATGDTAARTDKLMNRGYLRQITDAWEKIRLSNSDAQAALRDILRSMEE